MVTYTIYGKVAITNKPRERINTLSIIYWLDFFDLYEHWVLCIH